MHFRFRSIYFHAAVLVFLLFGSHASLWAQQVDFWPNVKWPALPIVHIWTDSGKLPSFEDIETPEGAIGNGIVNNAYEAGRLHVMLGDSLLYESGEYVPDVSGVRIRVRGNGSAHYVNPPYRLKFSKKADPLGFGYKHKSWGLLKIWALEDPGPTAPVFDNIVGRTVGLLCGMEWQPEYKFVNLFINGFYRGLYQWAELVDAHPNRVAVEAEGFLVENDAYWWIPGEVYFRSARKDYLFAYTYKSPDAEEVTDSVQAQMLQYFNTLEESLYNKGDVARRLDYTTFAGWLLAHDLLGTLDYGGSNMYYYNYAPQDSTERGLLRMGPLWDFDSNFRQPLWSGHHAHDVAYFPPLLKRQDFVDAYLARWNAVKSTFYARMDSVLTAYVETQGDALDASIALNNRYLKCRHADVRTTRDSVLRWFAARLEWMEAHVQELQEGVVPEPEILPETPEPPTEPTPEEEESASEEEEPALRDVPVTIYALQGNLQRTYPSEKAARQARLPRGVYIYKRGGERRGRKIIR